MEGKQTSLNLAYKSTTKTIKNFLINNWLTILISFILGIFVYILFKNRFYFFKTKNKINKLEKESRTIQELLKQSQKEYFEKGKMSEATYRIRINKFSELMRDIDRQIPLLKADLARLNRKSLQQKEETKKKPKKKTKKKKHKKK